MKKYSYLVLLPLIFFLLSSSIKPAFADSPNAFQVLVDTNLLFPDEAVQASRFAADGVWSITFNSDRYGHIDWPVTLRALNAQKWIVSEDNPGITRQADFSSNAAGRVVDGAMFYIEGHSLATIISDDQIQQYSAHVVPGFGPVGKRIIILGRTFQPDTNPNVITFKHALQNPLVSGGVFEFQPNKVTPGVRFFAGCQFVLSLNKKCYVLLPPGTTSDYLSEIQNMVSSFENKGILNNPDFYIVLAAYNRDLIAHNPIHYLSTGPGDRHSIEAVVKWLNEYRHIQPTQTPTLKPGDLNGDGKVDIFDYNILVGKWGDPYTQSDYNILVGNFGK